MQIQRRGEDRLERSLYGGSGVLGLEYFFRTATALPSQVMSFHLEPGSSEGEHIHHEGDTGSCTPGSSDELYIVTAGEVEMTVDGESSVLRAGDALYAPAGTRHGVVNRSDAAAELVLVFGAPSSS